MLSSWKPELPLNYRKQQQSLLKETDRETLNSLAARVLSPEDLAIVVVGDLESIGPSLEELEIPIVLLDESGEIIE